DRQVVVVLREDAVAEAFQRETRQASGKPVVSLAEGAQKPRIPLRQRLRQLTLQCDEERTLRSRAPEQDEGVVRDAHERRREDADESLVVVPVAEQAQVSEEIDDLLLPEVPASRATVRRHADSPQLVLVPLRV